jgi:hypothetical protein
MQRINWMGLMCSLIAMVALLYAGACKSESATAVAAGTTYAVNPPDQATIDTVSPVVISFSSAMDPSVSLYGGSMLPESNGPEWSSTAHPNDTLTFHPTGQWNTGLKTLLLVVNDAAARAVGVSVSFTCNCGGAASCALCYKCGGLDCVVQDAGEDILEECGALNCFSYYWGWSGNTCYRRANFTAGSAGCDGAGACQTVAQMCPTSGQGSAAATCGSGTVPTGGTCVGTTGPVCTISP